jgi:DNA polymerase
VQRPPAYSLEADIAAALDWWRDAGVDVAYADEAQAWLTDVGTEEKANEEDRRPATPVATTAPPPPAIGGPRSAWPQDLKSFHDWWLSEPSLDEGGLSPRVAPVGQTQADLMVLVAMPEEGDSDLLLSGPHGRLLAGFLTAADIPANRVYRAAALPRHTPLADWDQIARDGMGAVLAHHLRLAQPKRVLVFGRNILPLCGHDPAQAAQKLRYFNHEGGRVPALFVSGLERLLGNWQLRSRLWEHWLEWTETDAWRDAGG